MREGYCSCLVCMCIRLFPLWLLQRPLKPANNGTHGFLLGFSWINMCGVSKKPSVEKLWRGKANMQMIGAHRQPLSRSFGTNETQQLREGQLMGRMMLQRLATGATGVKQARYRRRPTRGSEALVRACAVYIYTTLVYVRSCCC